jgi:hypothetical protein
MNTDNERIEKFLKGIVPPEYESDEHRRQLRGQILRGIESGRGGKRLGARWKTAALALGLLCAGAAATELTIQTHHYYFEGRGTDGAYHFQSDRSEPHDVTYIGADGKPHHMNVGGGGSSISAGRELDAAGIERARKDLEEEDVLRQQQARELVGVFEIVVNGKPVDRTFEYKYVLSDGRTETCGEGENNLSQAQLEQQYAEIDQLRAEGKGDIRKAIDMEYQGQTIFRTLLCYYVLSNGRVVSIGEQDTNLPAPSVMLTTNQLSEFWRLVRLKEGEFAGTAQAQVGGRNFNFKRYQYKLSDGTTVTQSEGDPEGGKSELGADDLKELGGLLSKGQPVGGYDEEVNGTVFHFTSTKLVLSDGTEVLWSHGTPQSDAGAPATAQPISRKGGIIVGGGLTTNREGK